MANLRDLIRPEPAPAFQLPRWLDRLVSAGVTSTDSKVVRRQKVVNVAAMAGAFNAGSRVLAGFYYDADNVALLQAISFLFFVAAALIHRLHRLGDNAGAIGMVAWFIASSTSAAAMFGLQSQVQSYFVLGGIVWLVFGLENWRSALAALLAVVATMFGLIYYVPEGGIVLPARSPAADLLAAQSLINAITTNAVVILYALFLLRRAEGELERQSRRAEALVSVVLPSAVAERLRAAPDRRIADRIEQATILFADLEGFTTAAHNEPPEKVVAYLDELVRGFDEMCARHGVEKIKMIGDAFMAAGGLRGEGTAGAVAVGGLALDMMALQKSYPPLGARRLRLRVGIHTGPAIAGVIGDTRIAYDLWGDAVNVASRMESHGVPGHIHVSDAFREIADDAFAFEERGEIAVRGLGRVHTYFLLRER